MKAEWINIEDRLPEDDETFEGRVPVIDEEGLMVIGLLCGDELVCEEVEAVKWLLLEKA